MKKIISSMLFKLLLVLAFFVLIVNIAYGHGAVENPGDEDPAYEKAPYELQAIFKKLREAAGPEASDITLWIYPVNNLNAHMDSASQLVLYRGLLNFAIRDRNDYDMVAGVMAHEIGHDIYNHTRIPFRCSTTDRASRNCEREADWYGIQLMHKAGFDCYGDSRFYKEMIKTWGDTAGTGSHPSQSERLEFSLRACKSLKDGGDMPPIEYEKAPAPKTPPIIERPDPIYN